ncbi:MAG: hypothetical protein GX638_10625 [Crenarchaeota archaeon]|nr:hypothetical protein [Thermoproteota archaeon]
MYDWIYAIVGFLIMFGMLVGIGINQPRGVSMKAWCYGYFIIAIGFDILVVLALVSAADFVWLTNLLLGLSAGAATGLAIHVAHHIQEANEEEAAGHSHKAKSPFGF